MPVEIILSKVPMPHGKNSTFILRVDDPYDVNWEQIFAFCEEKTKLPRRFMRACNFDGKHIMGKVSHKENINYDNFSGLSNEIKAKLKDIKPKTLGQALRIDGVTPAAVIIILGYIKKSRYKVSA